MASPTDSIKKQQADEDLQPIPSVSEGAVKQLQEGKTTDAVDDAVLRLNGHEAVLERQFSWISALGLAFSITNSWVGYLSCFGQNLIYGGPQSVIFGLIVAFFVQYTITLGLSELASAYPSSGGQYHFCYILAPPKTRRFAAFIVGWMSMIAWWLVTSSGVSLAAVCTTGLVQFFHPGFEAKAWQIWLIYCTVALITLLPVYFAPKKVPVTVQATLYMSLVGCVLWFVVILAMKGETQPASFITRPGLGTSGWSDSTAWLLGISNAMYTFGGTDGAIHISEEVHQPGRRIPQVMSATMFIGLLTSLPLFIALMFCMTSLDGVLSSPLASLETVYQATGSRTATTFLVIWLLVIYIVCLSSQWVTAGRIAWAFARDGGLPFSDYFAHVSTRKQFPVRTTIAAFVFVCLYGLLYLASTTAFNSIVTSAVLFLNISYVVPQGILLFQGRDKLPARWLNLGYLGYFCNTFAILWIGVLAVTVCMPPSLPVAVGSMNYTSVSLVGLALIIFSFWFTIGGKFKGPDIDWDAMEAAKVAAILLRSSDA
ncbi:amino acid/polyamine transporter I [Lophiotrema nucula]|uniref:Amino acid/polyamine transporter I n=1 Tax=Lophiotrema nucula TaxID=690887 RepID=A0A6A5ZN94_9PLEO|nr:amino acid/polyamine transporter I [Lophiotrema nucula]